MDSSSQTLDGSSPSTSVPNRLDLSGLPPIFVSATHFQTEDLHELEDDLMELGASLTYEPTEVKIILSKATKKARILFDLRSKGLWTQDAESRDVSSIPKHVDIHVEPATKRSRLGEFAESGKEQSQAIVIDDSSTASETEDDAGSLPTKVPKAKPVRKRLEPPSTADSSGDLIQVVQVKWFEDSKKAGVVLPLDDYISYQGRRVAKPGADAQPEPKSSHSQPSKITPSTHSGAAGHSMPPHSTGIIERAKEDSPRTSQRSARFGKRKFGHAIASTKGSSWEAGHGSKGQYAHLLHTTTSEYEEGASSDLPEMPDWVKARIKYACQRLSPRNNPNDAFIDQLKKIKLARVLTNDEIGVRAYSTSIAALVAYLHKISVPREILLLPGCDAKIANLYIEWANTGRIQAVEEIEKDPDLQVIKLFYDIWGVGATTAKDFYYKRGWRDMDDVVEHGWSTLTRQQQVGVKYYNEFLDPIPRGEVEEIGRIIQRHAVKVRNGGVQSLIVGGYRRGKEVCGDVDVIVSHPDEQQTLDLINDLVASLEEEGWVTYTLELRTTSTNRGQETLPFKTDGGGHGFDSLDKAFVVWQNPHWPTEETDLAADPDAKNPNIHRRVDIIISPWRTVGCAVAGWTSGTTFQRDLRRYAKAVKGWKFDSSGVRDRANGQVVDVEGFYRYDGKIGEGRAESMEQAEKRVFEAFDLEYREPWERCTG